MEEEYFFPLIEEYTGEKGIMETNVNQHAAFQAGVERFRSYVFETTPEVYDGGTLKEIVDSFGPVLTTHLTEEISSLLALDKFGGEALEKAYRELDAKILASITDKVCVLILHLERDDDACYLTALLASLVTVGPCFERCHVRRWEA